jgi:hypothetical protein
MRITRFLDLRAALVHGSNVVLALVVMAATAGAQLPQTLPIRSMAGLLVVDAFINGRPAPLLLDTGAWTSMVDTAAVRARARTTVGRALLTR